MFDTTGGPTFCVYITPCGYCSRLNLTCPERDKPKSPSRPTGSRRLLDPPTGPSLDGGPAIEALKGITKAIKDLPSDSHRMITIGVPKKSEPEHDTGYQE